MAFTPKDWKDAPDGSTPLSASALENMETRLSAYTDSEIASLEATVVSTTQVGAPVGQFVKQRLDAGLDTRILVVGDSMSNASDEWVYLMADLLADEWPTSQVRVHAFDIAVGTCNLTSGSASAASVVTTGGTFANGQRIQGAGITQGTTISSGGGTSTLTLSANATRNVTGSNIVATSDAYGSPTTVQVDGGGPALDIYLWAMPGATTFHAMGVGSAAEKFGRVDPHLTFIALGRNHGSGGAVPAYQWGTDLRVFREWLAQQVPGSALMLVAQPPSTTDTDMTARRIETLEYASLRGDGFLDIWRAFEDSATAVADLLNIDGIHPNAAGSALWAAEAARQLTAELPIALASIPRQPSSFDRPVQRNLATNGDMAVRCGRIVLGSSTFTTSSPVVGVSSTTGLKVGAYVSGGNLPASTQILSIDSPTQITCTKNCTSGVTATLTQQQHPTYCEASNLTDGTYTPAAAIASARGSLPAGHGGMSPSSAYLIDLRQSAEGQAYLRGTLPVGDITGREIFMVAWVDRDEDDGGWMRPYFDQIGGVAVTNMDRLPSGPSGDRFGGAWLGFDRPDHGPIPVGLRYFLTDDATSSQWFVYVQDTVSGETGARGGLDRVCITTGPIPGDSRRAMAVPA